MSIKNMLDKKHTIKDFIGIFDGFVLPEICDEGIAIYNSEQYHKKRMSRIQAENTMPHRKKDDAIFFCRDTQTERSWKFTDTFINSLKEPLDIYLQETAILEYHGTKKENMVLPGYKIQKTSPGGGYHVWHVEQPHTVAVSRVLVYTIYLNDVVEGGETEFLFQKKRVAAKKGRICIFPANFPYVHRGNPPLKEDKYILTSWVLNNLKDRH